MRLLTAAALGAGLYVAAGALVPFSWTHRLSEACHWVPVEEFDKLGLARGNPNADDNVARAACFARRGAYGTDVNVLLRVFPDRVTLASLGRGG